MTRARRLGMKVPGLNIGGAAVVDAPTGALERFIHDHTVIEATKLVPEIPLHLGTEIAPLWEATESQLGQAGLPPPYWAFAWPGGQAVARYLLDLPEVVRGKRVLDFASGCGIGAIAARLAGGREVYACDIDPFAATALAMNASLSAVDIEIWVENLLGRKSSELPSGGVDIVIAGDIFYERPMAERATAWLQELSAAGILVIAGDPGRTYLPKSGLRPLAQYRIPTSLEVEDSVERSCTVYQFMPTPAGPV